MNIFCHHLLFPAALSGAALLKPPTLLCKRNLGLHPPGSLHSALDGCDGERDASASSRSRNIPEELRFGMYGNPVGKRLRRSPAHSAPNMTIAIADRQVNSFSGAHWEFHLPPCATARPAQHDYTAAYGPIVDALAIPIRQQRRYRAATRSARCAQCLVWGHALRLL